MSDKPISPDDPILGPARGSVGDIILATAHFDFGVGDACLEYLDEIYRLAPLVGIDPAIVVAQSALETGNWTTKYWTDRRNPAGIGVSDVKDRGWSWPNGTMAARAQIVRLWLYVNYGKALPEAIRFDWSTLHTDVLNPKVEKWLGTVRTIRDLTGKWATDPLYAEKIAKRGNELFGFQEEKDLTTYDLATDYARYGLSRDDAHEILMHRFDYRLDADAGITGRPAFIVLHIQDGTTPGSLKYWTGVQASATVLAQKDGSLLKVISEEHGPWTNGDVQAPTDEADEILSFGGNPNIWTLSIEAEGMPFGDHPEVQLNAIAGQCREWMSQYGIPLNRILRHGWINSKTRANCPGSYFEAVIQRLGSGGPMPTNFPAGLDKDLAAKWFGEVKVGKTVYKFDPNGPVSQLWLASGIATGAWPKLTTYSKFDTREYWTFANALVLWRPNTQAPVRVLGQ
jgi:hypothetical protein